MHGSHVWRSAYFCVLLVTPCVTQSSKDSLASSTCSTGVILLQKATVRKKSSASADDLDEQEDANVLGQQSQGALSQHISSVSTPSADFAQLVVSNKDGTRVHQQPEDGISRGYENEGEWKLSYMYRMTYRRWKLIGVAVVIFLLVALLCPFVICRSGPPDAYVIKHVILFACKCALLWILLAIFATFAKRSWAPWLFGILIIATIPSIGLIEIGVHCFILKRGKAFLPRVPVSNVYQSLSCSIHRVCFLFVAQTMLFLFYMLGTLESVVWTVRAVLVGRRLDILYLVLVFHFVACIAGFILKKRIGGYFFENIDTWRSLSVAQSYRTASPYSDHDESKEALPANIRDQFHEVHFDGRQSGVDQAQWFPVPRGEVWMRMIMDCLVSYVYVNTMLVTFPLYLSEEYEDGHLRFFLKVVKDVVAITFIICIDHLSGELVYLKMDSAQAPSKSPRDNSKLTDAHPTSVGSNARRATAHGSAHEHSGDTQMSHVKLPSDGTSGRLPTHGRAQVYALSPRVNTGLADTLRIQNLPQLQGSRHTVFEEDPQPRGRSITSEELLVSSPAHAAKASYTEPKYSLASLDLRERVYSPATRFGAPVLSQPTFQTTPFWSQQIASAEASQEVLTRTEDMPIAIAGVDTNHDGRANFLYVGVDRNHDGIPDALQGNHDAVAIRAEGIYDGFERTAARTLPPTSCAPEGSSVRTQSWPARIRHY